MKVPEGVTGKIVGIVHRCEGCGVKTDIQFDDDDRPKSGESRAIDCPACGAVRFYTFDDPLLELQKALDEARTSARTRMMCFFI